MVMYYMDYNNLPPASAFRLDKSGLDYIHNISMFEGRQSPPLSIRLQQLLDQLQEYLSPYRSSSQVLLETIPDESEPEAPHIMESPTVEDCLQQQQQYPIPPERGKGEVRCRRSPTYEDCLRFLYSASKDELKSIRGIKEARAKSILELREEAPEAFKSLADFEKHLKAPRTHVTMMMKAATKKLKEYCQ